MFEFDFMYFGKYLDFMADSDPETWSVGLNLKLYPLSLCLDLLFFSITIHWSDPSSPGRI